MPAMRGIAPGTEVGVMRRHQHDSSAGTRQAVQLFHRSHHVADVFDHVDAANLVEGTVAERVRRTVQVAQHVGGRLGIVVNADGAGVLVASAADVECHENDFTTRRVQDQAVYFTTKTRRGQTAKNTKIPACARSTVITPPRNSPAEYPYPYDYHCMRSGDGRLRFSYG